METLKTIKDYISDGYSLITNEAWQLGVDTKKELGNLYNELITETSDIVIDITNSVIWGQESEDIKEETPVEKIDPALHNNSFLDEQNNIDKVKVEVFAVEAFSNKDTPAIININEVEKKTESNF